MAAPAAGPRRRLYDSEPHCTEIVERLKQLPPEVREIFATLLKEFASLIRAQQKRSGIVREMGMEAMTGLMTREKRRWYDEDLTLAQAIKQFYTLDQAGRTALTFRLHESVSLVALYYESCRHAKLPQVIEDVRAIILTSIHEGPDEGRQLLEQLASDHFS